MTTWTQSDIVVNDVKLHYFRTGGDKPPVILAHGITDNGLCWTRLAKAMETEFDLLLVDARGHGLSDKPEQGYSAHVQADDLAQFIQTLGLKQPAIIGHSMGGVVAGVLADTYPDLIGRLILEDPAWYPRDEDITQEEIIEEAHQSAIAITKRKTKSIEEIKAQARQDHPLWDSEEFPPFAQAKLQVSPNVTEYSVLDPKPWWEIVPNLKCPVLLLTGEAGRVAISPEIEQEVRELNPDIQVTRLAGAGHNIRREQFEEYVQQVRAFLREDRRSIMGKKIIDSWFDAFRQKDISKLELAEDFVHASPFGEIKGREAYLNLVRENEEAFFSPVIEIIDVIENGDKFAVRYLVNGNPACDCIYVRNDKISAIYAYYHLGETPVL